MAGYMNYILTEYTNDPIHITQLFGFDHLLDFMISSQFNNVFSRLTENQKIIVLAFLELVLVYCQPSDLHKLTVLFRIRSAVAVQTNGDESSLWAFR